MRMEALLVMGGAVCHVDIGFVAIIVVSVRGVHIVQANGRS